MNLSETKIRKMSDKEFIRFQKRRQTLIKEAMKRDMETAYLNRAL